jgi:hypothetical protein
MRCLNVPNVQENTIETAFHSTKDQLQDEEISCKMKMTIQCCILLIVICVSSLIFVVN